MSRAERLSRRDKRISRHVSKQIARLDKTPAQVLPTADALLDQEEDLGLWNSTLQAYTSTARYTLACVRFGMILETGRLPEQLLRDSFSSDNKVATEAGIEIGNSMRGNRRLSSAISEAYGAMRRPKGDFTNPELEALWGLMADPEIAPMDVLREVSSYVSGMRDLTQMQVDWLRKRSTEAAKAKKIALKEQGKAALLTQTQVDVSTPVEASNDSKPFELEGTELFVTNRRWSTEPADLVPIRTANLPDALGDIRDACRSHLTIKPISVINALVFSRRPDVAQRTLLMNHRFITPEMRKWMRLPRGRDQIVVQEVSTDEASQLVFFVTDGETVMKDARQK